MDFRALHYFAKIAELGSITRAAQHLNVAQPALSRHVRQLEDELGAQLLIRESRGIRLTDQGRELFDHAMTILRDVQRAKDEVRGSAGSPGGNVVLGLVPTICPLIAPDLVSILRRDFPRIDLTINESYSQPLMDWLDEGRLDLAVVTEPPPTRRATIDHLIVEEMMFVTARGARKPGAISLEELGKTPLIMSRGIRSIVDNLLGHKGPLVTIMLELNSIETIRLMARQGVATTILPRSIVRDDAKRGDITMHSIGPDGLFRRLATANSRTRRLSRSAQTVKDTIIQIVGKFDEAKIFRS
ncbi:MAG: LysR family transcriptional regulator [Xanthobacteraceae bacterium]|nr:LysR family transcriptional regulator [Xanthobacteraceae bacterium]